MGLKKHKKKGKRVFYIKINTTFSQKNKEKTFSKTRKKGFFQLNFFTDDPSKYQLGRVCYWKPDTKFKYERTSIFDDTHKYFTNDNKKNTHRNLRHDKLTAII